MTLTKYENIHSQNDIFFLFFFFDVDRFDEPMLHDKFGKFIKTNSK